MTAIYIFLTEAHGYFGLMKYFLVCSKLITHYAAGTINMKVDPARMADIYKAKGFVQISIVFIISPNSIACVLYF